MGHPLKRSALAGIAATAVMTMVIMVAPYMGLPPMNPAEMLSSMTGMPIVIGWIMHLMIGITFAVIYGMVFLDRLNLANLVVKGAIYGVIVFMFAQAVMLVMKAMMGPGPEPAGSMGLMIIGSVMGHMIFGIVLALMIRPIEEKIS